MKKQIPALPPAFTIADDDLFLMRDTSGIEDQKVSADLLRQYAINPIPLDGTFNIGSSDVFTLFSAAEGKSTRITSFLLRQYMINAQTLPPAPQVDSDDFLIMRDVSEEQNTRISVNQLAALSMPIGMVTPYSGATAPSGWLLCDGEEVSRASYADLFNVIGETYGAGDGSTTFNLPDLRGEFVRGLDNGRGIDSGRTLGSDQGSQYGQHSHPAGPLATGSSGVPHTHTQPSTSSSQGTIANRTFLNHITGPGQTTTLMFDAGSTPGTTSSNSGPHSHPTPANVGTAPAPSTSHSHPVTGTTGNAGGTPNSSETRPRNIALNYIIKV